MPRPSSGTPQLRRPRVCARAGDPGGQRLRHRTVPPRSASRNAAGHASSARRQGCLGDDSWHRSPHWFAGKLTTLTLRVADARRDHVSCWRTQLPRLLQRKNACRIWTNFHFRHEEIATDCFNDEVWTAIPSACKATIRRAFADLLNLLNEVGAFNVWIERNSSTQLEREVPSGLDRLDRDNSGGSPDARSLNGTQTQRAGAKHADIRSRIDRRHGHRRGQPDHADVVEHGELDR